MKKVIVILLVLVFLGACLIAGVGGFFWYRMHKMHSPGQEGRPGGILSWLKKEPPPEPPTAPEPTEPQVQPPTEPPPEPQPPSTAESPQTPPTPAPTPTEPAKPKPKPAPKPASHETPSSAPFNDIQPDNVRTPESEPLVQPTTQEPATPPAATETFQPAKKKGPKGTLGIIFETGADQGDVLLHVDEQLVEKQSFRASSQQKFRLAKSVVLAPGPHKVRITVVKADGQTTGKDWQVDVPEGGNPVWKAELSNNARAFDLKQIQAR